MCDIAADEQSFFCHRAHPLYGVYYYFVTFSDVIAQVAFWIFLWRQCTSHIWSFQRPDARGRWLYRELLTGAPLRMFFFPLNKQFTFFFSCLALFIMCPEKFHCIFTCGCSISSPMWQQHRPIQIPSTPMPKANLNMIVNVSEGSGRIFNVNCVI